MRERRVPCASPDLLRPFLAKHLSSEQEKYVLNLLKPFYQYVKRGEYPLKSERKLDIGETREVLGRAIGQEVLYIQFMSRATLFSAPIDEIGEEEYQKRSQHGLGMVLDRSLGSVEPDGRPGDIYELLLDKLVVSLITPLIDILSLSLGVNPNDLIFTSYPGDIMGCGIGDTLYYFLGCTIAGKTDVAERLEALIRLFQDCVPIHEEIEEPRTWLILVA